VKGMNLNVLEVNESLVFQRRCSNFALTVYLKQVEIIEYVMSMHYKKKITN
jgi:hypothetical protein